MTISKRDAKLLLCLAGILIFLALYLLVYTKFEEKTEAVRAETAALTPELQELRDHKANEAAYQTGIEESRAAITELSGHYPNDVRVEDKIMFAANMERTLGLSISAASFSEPAALLEFNGIEEREDGGYATMPLTAWSTGSSLSCSMTYPALKAAVDHLYAQQSATVLDSLSVSYDAATGELFGTMNLNQYFITGADGAYYPTQTPSFPVGTDNIFGTVTAVPVAPPAAPVAP